MHEKVFTVTNHQGNANQNHNEISLHMCLNGFYQKEKKQVLMTSVSKYKEKKKPMCTVRGNVNWYSHYGKQYGGSSKKLKIELHLTQQFHS